MPEVHRLSRQDARRIAVRAQLLDLPKPTDVMDVVRTLTFLQVDMTNVIAPSPDLVLWSRIGSSYDIQDLTDAIDDLRLVDLLGYLRPAEDIALHLPEMRVWPGAGELRPWEEELRDWVDDNDGCRSEILELLRQDGPLTIRDLPDTTVRPWRSSGWTDGQNVRRLLGLMVQRGEVAVAGRRGRDQLWDLAERVYPDGPTYDVDEAKRRRDARRLRALGIARGTGLSWPVEPGNVGEAGVAAVVEGVRGNWRVDPDRVGEPFAGRAALLSPIDWLVYDRKRMAELFEFDYNLEMYKPAAKRRWGYWALPILYGDRLIGKLDATADHEAGLLRVDAVHEDYPWARDERAAVHDETARLAGWLRLRTRLPR